MWNAELAVVQRFLHHPGFAPDGTPLLCARTRPIDKDLLRRGHLK
jgi:hypothetical protein